jgi:hypothetical protein
MSDEKAKKKFFKVPENFADASDAEIEAFALSIMDVIFADQEKAKES